MSWSMVNFGKHKGKSLPQVIFQDPDWFFSAYEEGIFEGPLRQEAEDIYRKATSIRIPQPGLKTLVAEYGPSPFNGSFVDLELVPQNQPHHADGTLTFRMEVIDLGAPRNFKQYRKIGCKVLLPKIKFYLFGNSGYRLTKKRCEEFFKENNNFER